MSHPRELRQGEEAPDPKPNERDLTEGEGFVGDYPDPPPPEETHDDTARGGT